jgi:alpha-ketoglutarate-dependent taurine dioxygenase
MHRARAFRATQEPRDMRRTTIKGDGLTAQQAAA